MAAGVSHGGHLLGCLALTGSGAFWTSRKVALAGDDQAVSKAESTCLRPPQPRVLDSGSSKPSAATSLRNETR